MALRAVEREGFGCGRGVVRLEGINTRYRRNTQVIDGIGIANPGLMIDSYNRLNN
ncbi:MAG: hypothetical protein AVDCRST_MAG93-177 [uncultured Chloroflexia bacterium]|uniref:Uncharacterized protein n=1 Tax=uncultured Chloroflexia bacterium TaxID=1672391 RepID=A0A6J4H478_9CHLR|nr:MAG: hypothetical protein AVDCRST_MAG93-177 [uncultured Chloroflexia bacterium]